MLYYLAKRVPRPVHRGCCPGADEPGHFHVPTGMLPAGIFRYSNCPTHFHFHMAINFDQFNGGATKRPFQFAGLTAEQVQELLRNRYGLSEYLMQEFPDITKRSDKTVGAVPLSFIKAGIIFEDQMRDTTYDAIAQELGGTDSTAYQYLTKFREAVKVVFGLEIVTAKDSVRLVDHATLEDRAMRVIETFKKSEAGLKQLDACVKSLESANQPVMLPAKAQAALAAYHASAEETVALPAAEVDLDA